MTVRSAPERARTRPWALAQTSGGGHRWRLPSPRRPEPTRTSTRPSRPRLCQGSPVDDAPLRPSPRSRLARLGAARRLDQTGARPHELAARRPPAGGGDVRRDRAQGPLLRCRARHRHRRDQAPARPVGRVDRERDCRHHAAGQPHRSRPRRRPGVLVVLDGGKALRKAVRDVFGVHTPVQRCIRHKERNVLDHLAEHQRDTVPPPLGHSRTTTPRWTGSRCSPTNSPAPIPALRPRCAKACRRR
jgi:hypothetical protein